MGERKNSVLLIVLLILVAVLVFPPLMNVVSTPPVSASADPVSTYYEYATTVVNGTALNSTDNLDGDDGVCYAVDCESVTSYPSEEYDYVDNNVSNVDASADKGTHSDFTAQQYGPDSDYDTLTEESAAGAAYGFVWLDAPVSKSYTTTSAWTDLDVSAECPSGATGVIIAQVADVSYTDYSICVRGKEDTNDYMSSSSYCEFEDETWRMQIVKLNADRVIQYWSENTVLKIYVMGYTVGNDPKYKTVPVDLGALTAAAWTNMDVSAYVDDDTDGLILFVQSRVSVDNRFAVRAVGSSNDHSAMEWEEYNIGLMIVKIDANDEFQYYAANTQAKIYLVAETKGSIDYLTTNFVDMSATSTGWTMRDLDDYATVPADASGCFLQFESTGSDYKSIAREYGTSWTFPRYDVGGAQELTGGSGINGDNQIDIYCENTQEDVYLHAITRYIVPTNYELDLEVQWTSANYTRSNEELCIYGGTMGSEDIRVDVWDGSAWQNLFTDLTSGWNNVSVTNYLTASTFTIRFKGATETGDTSQDTWQIDCTLLHTWTVVTVSEVDVLHTSQPVTESLADVTQVFLEDNFKFNTTVTAHLEWFNWTANDWANINSGLVGSTEVTWNKTWDSRFSDVINSTGYMKVRIYTSDESDAHRLSEDYLHWDIAWADTTPPAWSSAGTNNTLAGKPTLFHVKWTDNVGLSGFIFGTNNTGTWTNDTWTPLSGAADWSNVTKTLNSTVGIVVQWRVWANDTSNNWNDTGILSLTTHPPPTVSVTPSSITGPPPNVNETFSVNVTINNVFDLYAWQAGMTFNATVLQAINFTEGPFLKTHAQAHTQTTLWVADTINNTAGVISYHGCTLTGYIPGANGTGTLGTITFNVTNAGNSTLHLIDVKLLDSSLTQIPCVTTDGYFELSLVPKPPVASFTFSPPTPNVGQTVTFDASASTPNGGTITGYTWDFDDGNVTGPVTNPIITHVYTSAGNYNVTLNVTDSQGYWNTTWHIVPVVAGYDLNLRTLDWDLTAPIQGAYVYKDTDVKVSDANGWANWTAVTGTVYIKVKYYGAWVNGTFSVTMGSDKTIDVRCRLYDVIVTVKPNNTHGVVTTANVTVYNATFSGTKIKSGITANWTGQATLTNLPNSTLTLIVYAKSDYSVVIANVTRSISSDEQSETILADQNYGMATLEWEVTVLPDQGGGMGMLGDVDNNAKVDYADLSSLAAAYRSKPPDPRWNPNCDFDHNDKVDYADLFILAAFYGRKAQVKEDGGMITQIAAFMVLSVTRMEERKERRKLKGGERKE